MDEEKRLATVYQGFANLLAAIAIFIALFLIVLLINADQFTQPTTHRVIDVVVIKDKLPDQVDEALWKRGKDLFRGQCGACHKPTEDMTGPALMGAFIRWSELADFKGKSGQEWLYEWVRNYESVVSAKLPYAMEAVQYDAANMQLFPTLSNEDIDAIFYYVSNGSIVLPTIQ